MLFYCFIDRPRRVRLLFYSVTANLHINIHRPVHESIVICMQEVYGLIMREGFYIVHRNVFRMGMNRATLFYEEHRCELKFKST